MNMYADILPLIVQRVYFLISRLFNYEILILLIFLIGCAHKPALDNRLSLVIGCGIYDLEGKIIRSYPGSECIFFSDGSLLSYDPAKTKLQKFNAQMTELWSLKAHVHHGIHLTEDRKILLNSSIVKNNIRYDNLLLVNQDGKVEKTYSFLEHLNEITKNYHAFKTPEPYETQWDQNLQFTKEFTHLAASYEVPYDMPGFAEKGSILLTFNTIGRGVYVLDKRFKSITRYQSLKVGIFHDAQTFSPDEFLYFVNSTSHSPARIEFFNTSHQQESKAIEADFFAFFAGSIQVVNPRLMVVTDGKSKYGQVPDVANTKDLNLPKMVELSKHTMNRVLFISDDGKILREIHLNFKASSAKVYNLQDFLKHNVGL